MSITFRQIVVSGSAAVALLGGAAAITTVAAPQASAAEMQTTAHRAVTAPVQLPDGRTMRITGMGGYGHQATEAHVATVAAYKADTATTPPDAVDDPSVGTGLTPDGGTGAALQNPTTGQQTGYNQQVTTQATGGTSRHRSRRDPRPRHHRLLQGQARPRQAHGRRHRRPVRDRHLRNRHRRHGRLAHQLPRRLDGLHAQRPRLATPTAAPTRGPAPDPRKDAASGHRSPTRHRPAHRAGARRGHRADPWRARQGCSHQPERPCPCPHQRLAGRRRPRPHRPHSGRRREEAAQAGRSHRTPTGPGCSPSRQVRSGQDAG
jgi:hypothetical protein